ncbi:MAG TPA: hypothetical protein VJV78_22280 [Polyangiales bacterium]|nr:hypothetical protein [Polyangiales bacterium]
MGRLRKLAPWFGVWLLNTLLFVPAYMTSPSAFLPPLPTAKAVMLRGFLRSFVSMLLRRDNLDVFRVSFDLGCMVLLALASAGTRAARPVRWALVTGYVALLVFLGYHHAIQFFFERSPALSEDWRFLLNLGHFLQSVMSPRWFAICAGSVLGLVGVTLLAAWVFRALQRMAAGWTWRSRGRGALAFFVPCALIFAWLGVSSDHPVLQVNSKRVLWNWRTSRAEALRTAELHDPEPDRRYDGYTSLELATKPNFYLLMIEAYGEILATWDMTDAYRALLSRVEQRLSAAGYHARSVYSAAPVHSGTSWFSISTVHTGTLIDRPLQYDALQLVGARVPSITRFFESQGYRTYTLQPGSADHAGLRRLDLFNHDVVVDSPALDYPGWHYGWGHIPDQYSWEKFRERWFAHPSEPYYVYYMAVSTHWDWGEGVPPYVHDWRKLESDDIQPAEVDASWPPFPEAERIGTELRRSYFHSVEYEWRVLLDVLEADHSPNIVVAIVGDHQPRLESDAPGEVTMNAPVHIISRDAAFVESFAPLGFARGLYPEPTVRPTHWHEGLFSLWISRLVAAYGVPGSPTVPIYPRGIRLSTLSR